VIPTNIAIDMTAIATSVCAALRLSGGRKAGTPFETASTPVSAVQPFENAVSSTKSGSIVLPVASGCSGGATSESVPKKYRYAPTASIRKMLTMKKYVGTENIRPDSRTPRRLPSISMATNASASHTGLRCHSGSAEVSAATPAAMLTDTVST
jgi:hypothetical protein